MTPVPKPEKRATTKRRKDRIEDAVKSAVRAEVFARDEERCAVVSRLNVRDSLEVMRLFGVCQGPLQHSHLKGKRRSQTRNMDPHHRHSSAFTLALCERHHSAEERKGLRFIGLTVEGMNGPISYHVEPEKGRVH